MTAPKPKKERKLTPAAIAALWLLHRDHHNEGPAWRDAKSVAETIGHSTASSVRYGISVLDQEGLVRFHGYEYTAFTKNTRVMTWMFNTEAEERATAIIEASHEQLLRLTAYRDDIGYYDRLAQGVSPAEAEAPESAA